MSYCFLLHSQIIQCYRSNLFEMCEGVAGDVFVCIFVPIRVLVRFVNINQNVPLRCAVADVYVYILGLTRTGLNTPARSPQAVVSPSPKPQGTARPVFGLQTNGKSFVPVQSDCVVVYVAPNRFREQPVFPD